MPDWRARLRAAFAAAGHVPDAQVVEELNAHAEAEYDAARAGGDDEAQATARVEPLVAAWAAQAPQLGRPPSRPPAVPPPPLAVRWWRGVAGDTRYALRLLVRQRGAALLPVATIALGIAAVATLWTVVNGVLLRPLPWRDPDRLIRLTELRDGRAGRVRGTIFNGSYLAWADHPSTIDGIGGWFAPSPRTLSVDDREPARVTSLSLTPSMFTLLGVPPLIGRILVEADGAPEAARVAVVSYGLWHEQFGGDPGVIGRSVRLDDQPYTIVGVMDRGFAFPDHTPRIWIPFRVPPTAGAEGVQTGVIFQAIARLRPGATLEQAAAEGTARARAGDDASTVALAMFGATGPIDIRVARMRDALVADVRPALLVMLAAVVLLFVAAIANVASLQLTRMTVRRRELAVRAALGAGVLRLWQQLAVESLIVGCAGALIGIALTLALTRALPGWLPADFPRQDAIQVDAAVLAVALALSLVCGLAPAWLLRRQSLAATLVEDGGAPPGGLFRVSVARSRAAIAVCQVAVSCVLLTGAVLLSRSFVSLLRVDRGYDATNVLTARLIFPPAESAERRHDTADRLLERLRAQPGVAQAAYTTSLPLLGPGASITFTLPTPYAPGGPTDVEAAERIVSPGYLGAMRLRLVSGRFLADADTATSPPVAVVNRAFAARYLGGNAIGARLPQQGPRAGHRFGDGERDLEVVGVVDDVWQEGPETGPRSEIFVAVAQAMRLDGFVPVFILKTANEPASHVPALRRLVRQEAPAAVLDSVMTMEDRLANSLARPRLYAAVLTLYAGFTLLLSGIGLFGMMAQSVVMRTREIGIRTAIGARTRDIVGLVLRQAAAIAAAGMAIGLPAAAVGSRYLSSFLYGVSSREAATFTAVALAVTLVALAACAVPARRAAQLDPVDALRQG